VGIVVGTAAEVADRPPGATAPRAPDRVAHDADAPGARTRVVIAVLATLAVATPFLVLIATRAGRPYLPVQDLAVINLRARDLFSLHPPLTGPWSRAGFAHPGPLFYWLLGLGSGITGHATWSLLVTAALVRIAAIVASARLAWVRGGLSLCLLVLGATTGALIALDPGALLSPWNVFAALAWYPVFLLLAWSVALGEVRRLPWLVVVGTFLVQTHLGYALLLLPTSVWIVVVVLRNLPASERRATLTRPLAWSAIWLVVFWLPVAVDQLFVTSNVRELVYYAVTTHEPHAGLGQSAGWLAEQFQFLPAFLGGPLRRVPVSGFAASSALVWLLVPIALFAVAVVASRRRGDLATKRFVTLTGIATASALLAMAMVTGDQLPYLIEWRTFTALLIAVACFWSLRWWVREPVARRSALAVLVLVVLVGSVTLTRSVLDVPQAIRAGDDYVGRVATRLVDETPDNHGLLVRAVGRQNLGIMPTFVDEMERRGRPVHVDAGLDFEYGPQRTMKARAASTIWVVAEDGWVGSRLRAIPGGKVVFSDTGLDARDERTLAAAQRRLYDELRRAHHREYIGLLDAPWLAFAIRHHKGVDLDLAARVASLNQRSNARSICRCVVVAFHRPDAKTRRTLEKLRATS
jgi:hypothetical protein